MARLLLTLRMRALMRTAAFLWVSRTPAQLLSISSWRSRKRSAGVLPAVVSGIRIWMAARQSMAERTNSRSASIPTSTRGMRIRARQQPRTLTASPTTRLRRRTASRRSKRHHARVQPFSRLQFERLATTLSLVRRNRASPVVTVQSASRAISATLRWMRGPVREGPANKFALPEQVAAIGRAIAPSLSTLAPTATAETRLDTAISSTSKLPLSVRVNNGRASRRSLTTRSARTTSGARATCAPFLAVPA